MSGKVMMMMVVAHHSAAASPGQRSDNDGDKVLLSFQEYILFAVRAPVKSGLTANCTTFFVFVLWKAVTL